MSLYTDIKALLAEAETDLAADPTIVIDLEAIGADVWAMVSRCSPTDKPKALFNSLPILARLSLTDTDKGQLETFREQCLTALTASGAVGKVNWCNVVATLEATIAALTAAGVPIPPYLTIIVDVVSSLCPTPTHS